MSLLRFVPCANKAAGAVCSLPTSEPFAHVQIAARCLVVTFPEPVRPGAQNAPQSTNHYSSPSSWIVATKDVLKRQDKDLEMLLNDFMIKF